MRFQPVVFALILLVSIPAAVQAERQLTLTHGPILGRLTAHSVGVWARTSRPGQFVVRYGTVPGRLSRASQPVSTTLADDCTAWTELKGLKGRTKYYYEVVLLDERGTAPSEPAGKRHSGSFRTLPDPRDYADKELNPRGLFNFSFEFACGNNQTPGQGLGAATPTFATLYEKFRDRIDFAILNGDWLYEQQREYAPAQWLKATGTREDDLPHVVRTAPTVVGVWENYKGYLKNADNLSRWHRHMPAFFTFDDHEMLNDIWGAGTPGLRDRRACFRDIGVAAWYDYLGWSNPTEFSQPVVFGRTQLEEGSDVLIDKNIDFTRIDMDQVANLHVHWGTPTAGVNENALDGVGGDPNAGVYEIVKVLDKHRLQVRPEFDADGVGSYSVGRRNYYRLSIANCDLFLLDTRSHREMHDVNNPGDPTISMIGPKQREWLLDGVKKSDADFIFVVSSVNFMVPHVGGGKVRAENKDDAWTVFFHERDLLIDTFDKLGKPVFILTGDLHNSFAIKITDRVWEFASGPHNSNNHWYTDEGDRPATGKFKYGPRECDIRWSTWFGDDIPRNQLGHPHFCVVQVNNVFNNPIRLGETRWRAFERPQVIFQYYDGHTGEFEYAESIVAARGKQ